MSLPAEAWVGELPSCLLACAQYAGIISGDGYVSEGGMESPCNGRKFFVCLFTLFILIGVVKNASAQGWPEIPGLQSLNLGGIRIVPEVQIGYENFSLNFNLPAATLQSPLPPFPSTLDLQLKDANLWIGSLSAAF